MRKRIYWIAIALCVVFAAEATVLCGRSAAQGEVNGKMAQTASEAGKPGIQTPAPAVAKALPGTLLLRKADGNADSDDIAGMFRSDAKGNLVLDEKTRLNIEKLYALNTPADVKAKLKDASKILTPQAHRELVRLTNVFKKYTNAVIRRYPPGKELKTVEEAVKQHEGIHSLRVRYFGSEIAAAFYGEEENLNGRILEIMGTLDKSIPLPDRAHQAQMILKKSMESDPGAGLKN